MVELEDTVKGLKAQLEELIAAKEEDETAMLYKFRDLLNEKKLKIREQQKAIDSQLLGQKMSSATVDMSTAPLPPQTKKKAGASRPTKRKAQSSAVTEDTPESDETESMDVDKVKEEENDDEESGGETQTESVASTDDDSEDDNDVASRSHASSFNKPAQAEPPAPAGKKAAAQPPPKRSLPFAKSKPHAAAAQNKKGAESETDSDDEL
jgi:hypothetical protein